MTSLVVHTRSAPEPRRRHEIPTHLNVPDRAWLGLSVRQILYLAAGASTSYALWHEWSGLPPALRIGLAALGLLLATTALVRPGGRGLDEWAFALAHFAAAPKIGIWRSLEAPAAGPSMDHRRRDDWTEFTPNLRWPAQDRRDVHRNAPETQP